MVLNVFNLHPVSGERLFWYGAQNSKEKTTAMESSFSKLQLYLKWALRAGLILENRGMSAV